jgi:hypothetical protein
MTVMPPASQWTPDGESTSSRVHRSTDRWTPGYTPQTVASAPAASLGLRPATAEYTEPTWAATRFHEYA